MNLRSKINIMIRIANPFGTRLQIKSMDYIGQKHQFSFGENYVQITQNDDDTSTKYPQFLIIFSIINPE